ncbi:chromosome partitioning protein ParB [Leptospira interrogans serovar Szwajizak]|uniref:hypothetical protein n=1 Tax=Leptospira interrogans TaxID=173 RepID=UPI0003740ED6|nr:hypothetical protein [Leptospira interrogans]
MKRSEDNAREWMEEQESIPRPGSSSQKTYIPKGVTLNPIVKMVKPESLTPNPRNDFDPLTLEEYENLKEDISRNGILDALTAKKDGTLVTGENRYRIALELKDHEDEEVRRRVESIPVRYYMNELTIDEEYDILEGDNLFRRHLTPEQKKERLKRRILRKYKDELELDRRGGDRKSESLKEEGEEEQKSKVPPELLIENPNQKPNDFNDRLTERGEEKSNLQGEGLKKDSGQESNYQGDSLIEKPIELAKKVSENENIPLGTARRYVTELKKELKSKDPKPSYKKENKKEVKKDSRSVKDKAREFEKKYSKMNTTSKKAEVNRLVSKLTGIRKKRKSLEEETSKLLREDLEIVEKLEIVGEKKRIQGIRV